MNIQQHERIDRIKKLSRHLYVCLTWVNYLIWVWPLALIAVFWVDKGKINFLGNELKVEDFSYVTIGMIALFAGIIFFFVLKLMHHFRELIRHFSNGDVFNKKATQEARKALVNGLVLYGLYLCTAISNWIYSAIKNAHVSISIDGMVFGFMFFGLMYILLWALEIGCDLNEESELTI